MPESVYLLWLPLGTALIGALAALAGNAISPMFGARSSHQLWLRDKRAERFEEYYVLLDRAVISVENHIREEGVFNLDDQAEATLADAAARMKMYATPATARLASRTAQNYRTWEIYYKAHRQDPSVGTRALLTDQVPKFLKMAEATRGMIRAELRVD